MKTIGLLGGMSWESTQDYYRLINEQTKIALGGLHSAPIVMISVDFHEVEALQSAGDWDEAARILTQHCINLETSGADLLVICTNTMHIVADQIASAINIPLLHIADATSDEIEVAGFSRIGLLGTAFTMEQAFYKGRLESRGLEVVTPNKKDRDIVHRIIYDELCLGHIRDSSRDEYLRIINDLTNAGAQGVIAGCTEIGLLVKQKDTDASLFDTTLIHAQAAVRYALQAK